MKNKKLIILFLLSSLLNSAQIKFAEKGATWCYAFVNIPAWNGVFSYLNERVTYDRDSLLNGDTVKVLRHRFFYSTCYNSISGFRSTVIKQTGDTVFFRNARTNNTWQILINFAATQGTGWQTTMLKANNSSVTFSYTVDSVRQVQYNGMSLKRLYCGGTTFTERFGCKDFIFPYPSLSNGCDGYYFSKNLCYADSVFGLYQFGNEGCSFSGNYPILSIPTTSDHTKYTCAYSASEHAIHLRTETPSTHPLTITLSDVYGRRLMNMQTADSLLYLPADLSPGVYLISIETGSKQESLKIIIP